MIELLNISNEWLVELFVCFLDLNLNGTCKRIHGDTFTVKLKTLQFELHIMVIANMWLI